MAPSKAAAASAPFGKDERVLCFHHDMLYEAKVLDSRPTEDTTSWQYKIHYKGWKNTVWIRWDDWVPQDRVRKFTDENKELAAQLHTQMKILQKQPKSGSGKGKGGRMNGSESTVDSEERHASAAAQSSRGPRRTRDYEQEHEEDFHARPSVKLIIPDHVKAILVDDWENVTKNLTLVPLPAAKPVEVILNDYLEEEKSKRLPGSAQYEILEEVVAGLKEYFEKCLGRILLYRFERNQYLEIRQAWASSTGELAGKSAISTYGAEHLCRLLVSLPELIALTNMDLASVNRLREELSKLTSWLGRKAPIYFVHEYEVPGQDYVEKARRGA